MLLEGMLSDVNGPIDCLEILPETERRLVVDMWNATEKDYPADKCVHELFEEQVRRTPEATAVVFGEESLTYTELNARANRLAHRLRELGVKPDSLVAICVERSLEMIVGLLGILKAGGAYVPLDPDYPKERLTSIIEDSNVDILITEENLKLQFEKKTKHVICIDSEWEDISEISDVNLNHSVTPDNLAYVIYTSGSTGTPKGVAILHSAAVNFQYSMAQTPVSAVTISFCL